MNCMKLRKVFLFLTFAGALLVAVPSCARLDKYRSQRKNIKVEQKARKAEQKAYQQKLKAHYERQSDETHHDETDAQEEQEISETLQKETLLA